MRFSFPRDTIELVTDFYLDGICRHMAHGRYPDPGASNRELARRSSLAPADPDIPEGLLQVSSYREEEKPPASTFLGGAGIIVLFGVLLW